MKKSTLEDRMNMSQDEADGIAKTLGRCDLKTGRRYTMAEEVAEYKAKRTDDKAAEAAAETAEKDLETEGDYGAGESVQMASEHDQTAKAVTPGELPAVK